MELIPQLYLYFQMVSFSLIATFALAAVASAGAAPQVWDSPTNVVYTASFNKTNSGWIRFSAPNGTVYVETNINNLPLTGGPFTYHVHERPVPANGSCTATLGHLNPYEGAYVPYSNKSVTPAQREVGDLAGKHGPINSTSLYTSYYDPYLSLNPNDKAFIGNLSVVIHFANTTRYTCANFVQLTAVQPQKGGASKVAGGIAAVLPLAAGAAALLI